VRKQSAVSDKRSQVSVEIEDVPRVRYTKTDLLRRFKLAPELDFDVFDKSNMIEFITLFVESDGAEQKESAGMLEPESVKATVTKPETELQQWASSNKGPHKKNH